MPSTMNNTQAMLDQLPCAVGYKNLESIYTGGNDALARLMGYQKSTDIIGLRDYDVKHEMASLADCYIQQDQEVIVGPIQRHLDIGRYCHGDIEIHLSTKKPVYDDAGDIVGTVYSVFQLEPMWLQSLYLISLEEKGPLFYTIGTQHRDYNLSPRESQCLFYLIRSWSAKTIAKRLQLSPKTVEYYINRLKLKFSCKSRADLIDKLISLGFMVHIPISLIQ
jgi:DNA-binding CsgD family transcriptional regulator